MNRRWQAGNQFEIDGLRFRVVTGKKGPNDLRLDQWNGVRWVAIRMAVGAMMADFFFENEDVLYPPPAKGGKKYLDYIRDATRCGWDKAEAVLRLERAQKNRQPGLFAVDEGPACCSCDPDHIDVGGYDPGCRVHDPVAS